MSDLINSLKKALSTESAAIYSVPVDIALEYNSNGVKFYATDLPDDISLPAKYKIEGNNIVFKVSLSKNEPFILDAVSKRKYKTGTGYIVKGTETKNGSYAFQIPADIRKLSGKAREAALTKFVSFINQCAKKTLSEMNNMVKTAKYESGQPVYDVDSVLKAAVKAAKRGIDPVKALNNA